MIRMPRPAATCNWLTQMHQTLKLLPDICSFKHEESSMCTISLRNVHRARVQTCSHKSVGALLFGDQFIMTELDPGLGASLELE
jgi:hypothetical protein